MPTVHGALFTAVPLITTDAARSPDPIFFFFFFCGSFKDIGAFRREQRHAAAAQRNAGGVDAV